MIDQPCEPVVGTAPTAALDQLAAHLRARFGTRVRDLRLVARDGGLVLRGRTHTYYVKQLVQHSVLQVCAQGILANEIEVT
jgi:hypothetical protein